MAMHLLNSSFWVSMQEHTFYTFETLVRIKLSVPNILRGKYFLRRYSITQQNLSNPEV